jgi:hypothetical protein
MVLRQSQWGMRNVSIFEIFRTKSKEKQSNSKSVAISMGLVLAPRKDCGKYNANELRNPRRYPLMCTEHLFHFEHLKEIPRHRSVKYIGFARSEAGSVIISGLHIMIGSLKGETWSNDFKLEIIPL